MYQSCTWRVINLILRIVHYSVYILGMLSAARRRWIIWYSFKTTSGFTAGLQYKLIYISKVLIVFNYFIQSNYSALYLITILMNNNYNNFRSTESINSFYLLSHWKRTRLYGFISSNQEFVVFTFSLLCSILDYFLLCSYVTLKISKM